MGTVPTGRMERELRKYYLRWVRSLPLDADMTVELAKFRKKSLKIMEEMGGAASRLGVAADFPAPKKLELALQAGTIYSEMEKAAVSASIMTGLNANDAARAMLRGGMNKGHYKLKRLARTETVRAYWGNQWNEADGLGLVMVWSAERGPRTCQWCLNRDGLVVPDRSIQDHPNGRCTLVPTLPKNLDYKGSVNPEATDNKAGREQPTSVRDPAWDKPDTVSAVQTTPKTQSLIDDADIKSGHLQMMNNEGLLTDDELRYIMTAKSDIAKAAQVAARTSPRSSTATYSTESATKVVADSKRKYASYDKDVVPDQAMSDSFQKYTSQQSTEAFDTMDEYFGNAQSWDINAALRAGDAPDELAAKIGEVINGYELPETVNSYRILFDMDDLPADLTGAQWKDKAFQSTTLSRDHLDNVVAAMDKDGDPAVVLEMIIPKGTKAALNADEYEVLLQKGSSMRIVEDTTIGNTRTLKGYVE